MANNAVINKKKKVFLKKTKVGINIAMYKYQFVHYELSLVKRKDENWYLNDFESYFCLCLPR